jgi:hypothetical protein
VVSDNGNCTITVRTKILLTHRAHHNRIWLILSWLATMAVQLEVGNPKGQHDLDHRLLTKENLRYPASFALYPVIDNKVEEKYPEMPQVNVVIKNKNHKTILSPPTTKTKTSFRNFHLGNILIFLGPEGLK